jgi:hypothetical protein
VGKRHEQDALKSGGRSCKHVDPKRTREPPIMRKFTKAAIFALTLSLGAGDIDLGGRPASTGFFRLVPPAEAVVGRPLTPLSYAGVARRTTRRALRRGAYIAAIPRGCPYGTYYGYSLYYCGGTYYQRSGNGYVIVYF